MYEARANFNSVNGKRRILIVEDEAVNRDMLDLFLRDQYEILMAADGEEAMRRVWEFRETLSLVLLDLLMPNMSGQEVLRRMKQSPEMRHIPVIVISSDLTQEIECLNMGASDFIQKPYPVPGVIAARVHRTIELSEDRQIIQSTERDPKTGLYNPEFFVSYAEQYDQHHKEVDTDAIVFDINRFSVLNERFGRAYADDVLKSMAQKILELVRDSGGIVTRSGADVFEIYCPHRDDYKTMHDKLSQHVSVGRSKDQPIGIRMGVYAHVDKSLDIEARLNRARMAADTIRGSKTRSIGVYDDGLLKSELFSRRLVEDFEAAVERGEFVVRYQPKFDIQQDVPLLAGAEALVRWHHPELGWLNPGVFVPLFEENGLIQRLDRLVWEEAARQAREWKQAFGRSVPISVNVSRVDMYDSDVVEVLQGIIDRYELDANEFHLEVTESGYAEDSEQLVEAVGRLRSMGLVIEMDDFGTGYSSLNMLATLPIDVLKLDMFFVQTAFAEEADNGTHMLGAVVDIARHLAVPLIAEGVETQEQLDELKAMGCDMAQGFLLSEPLLPEELETHIRRLTAAHPAPDADAQGGARDGASSKASASSSERKRWWELLPAISLRHAELVAMILAVVVSVAIVVVSSHVRQGIANFETANERFILAQQAAADLEMGSDYLTENVRSFVMTGDMQYLENYFEELDVTKRRDGAVQSLEGLHGDNKALDNLRKALSYSNELVDFEDQAMKLTLLAEGYDEAGMPEGLSDVQLSAEQLALAPEGKRKLAQDLVFGSSYAEYKANIKDYAARCTDVLIENSEQQRSMTSKDMLDSLAVQSFCTFAMLVIILGIVLFVVGWIQRPLARMVTNLRRKELVNPAGAKELRFVAETYNSIFEDNRRQFDRLNYRSMHDALTGLYNRKAYDLMKHELDLSSVALLLVDVDKFKTVNDTYGHDVGDLVLVRVAEVLQYSFRPDDLVFRLGGDEFVVIMLDADSSMREQVRRKIDQANLMLQKPTGDLPPTSLSVGAAFSDRQNPEGDIFKDADTALYRMKESGRCGCVIY